MAFTIFRITNAQCLINDLPGVGQFREDRVDRQAHHTPGGVFTPAGKPTDRDLPKVNLVPTRKRRTFVAARDSGVFLATRLIDPDCIPQ
jgi:hypothetical protein